MIIANPIYDVVFKYLMEDLDIAKGMISAIIGEDVEEIQFQAREQIVDRLLENFKDSEDGEVDIDGKTGKVRINFQESYFVRGSAELSDSMKDLLRVMIPKYAKSTGQRKIDRSRPHQLMCKGRDGYSPLFDRLQNGLSSEY